jgi:hypothetical protein
VTEYSPHAHSIAESDHRAREFCLKRRPMSGAWRRHGVFTLRLRETVQFQHIAAKTACFFHTPN